MKTTDIHEGVAYHIARGIPLHESVYRLGSDEYFKMFAEARALYRAGALPNLDPVDEEILRDTQLGEWARVSGIGLVPLDMIIEDQRHELAEAEYQGKQVDLNKPKRGGSKKFYVYTRNPKTDKIVKVSFGAKSGGGNLAVKLRDPDARQAFADRHNCEQKNDKTKPGYWACRLPRYAKSLGLSGGGTWW